MDQFLSMWRILVSDRPNADVRDTPALSFRWADNLFPYLNMLFLTEPGMDEVLLRKRLLKEVIPYMRSKVQAGFVAVCEEFLTPEARTILPEMMKQAGLTLGMNGRGMASDTFPLPEPSHPDLKLIRVRSDEDAQVLGETNCRAWGWPIEAGLAGLDGSSLWKKAWSYMGLLGGQPVSVASILENEGCLFLALVATIPEAQRKGYGEVTVRKAMYEAAKATGLKRAILHATDDGFPVYQRIGYEYTTTFRFYYLAPPS